MSIAEQIDDYIASHPAPKQSALEQLHQFMLESFPDCELWFTDGRNPEGKIVTNPNIGYGRNTTTYADGSTKDFYRIGFSANTTGISVYILGLEDKTTLRDNFGDALGKASVTGYCIKFSKIADINIETLHEAIRFGMNNGQET